MFRLNLSLASVLLFGFAILSSDSLVPFSDNARIVGGQNASPNQFPYQVSLRNRETRAHFCGGFIINSRWVGASFRCTFWRQPAENILVVVGAFRLNTGGNFHQAITIVGHPEYRAEGFGTYENDLSLVQIKDSFTFSEAVAPIALGSSFIGGGINGVLAGWGRLSDENLVLPDNLQFMLTTTLTNADSRNRLPELMFDEITDRTFCSFTRAGQGSCFGDAGGVLVANGEAIGIAAFGAVGSRCAIMPDCYTRIASFRPWILNVTSEA